MSALPEQSPIQSTTANHKRGLVRRALYASGAGALVATVSLALANESAAVAPVASIDTPTAPLATGGHHETAKQRRAEARSIRRDEQRLDARISHSEQVGVDPFFNFVLPRGERRAHDMTLVPVVSLAIRYDGANYRLEGTSIAQPDAVRISDNADPVESPLAPDQNCEEVPTRHGVVRERRPTTISALLPHRPCCPKNRAWT